MRAPIALPSRRSGVPAHHAGARGACVRQAGPVGNRGIDIVQIGNVDLPVLAQTVPGRLRPPIRELRRPEPPSRCVSNWRRPGSSALPSSPSAMLERDAWRAEQARGGLGNLHAATARHRPSAGDGAQDFGAGGLAFARHARNSALQPGVLLPEISHHVRGSAVIHSNPFRPVPAGTEAQISKAWAACTGAQGRAFRQPGGRCRPIIPFRAHLGQRRLGRG